MTGDSRPSAADLEPNCPVCHSRQAWPVLEIDNLPVAWWMTYSEVGAALAAPTGSVQLYHCDDCALLFRHCKAGESDDGQAVNSLAAYDNRDADHADQVADLLSRKYTSQGDIVVEMASGDGRFLKRLCARGQCLGIGFDVDPGACRESIEETGRVELKAERFHFQNVTRYANLLVCRDLLERTPRPLAFLQALRLSMLANPGATLFCEVPDMAKALDALQYWHFNYGCSFFTEQSLRRLFATAALRIVGLSHLSNGRYLGVEAVAEDCRDSFGSNLEPDAVTAWTRRLARFAAHYQGTIDKVRTLVLARSRAERRGAISGAGAAEIAFMNMVGLGTALVKHAFVPAPPGTGGSFLPGTGQQICAWDLLHEARPDYVLCLAPSTIRSIRERIRQAGLTAEIVPVA